MTNDMQPPSNDNLDPAVPSRRPLVPRPVGWVLVGVLVGLLLAIPLRFTPVETWVADLIGSEPRTSEPDAELWTCPMHPDVIRSDPGQCPVCGMDLVPMADDEMAPDAAAIDHDAAELWTCPMHPGILEPEPGQSPICGMDLVPTRTEADEPPTAAAGARQGATVRIDPTVVQNMNVTTETVTRGDIRRSIRTVGSLDYDQDRMVTVTTKFPGFVEKVHVNYLGQPVSAGDPLFEVYSPELVQTQQELLSAMAYAQRLADAPDDARRRAESLVDAARQRLGYWDISAEQIRALEERGEIVRALTVTAPSSGLVMKRMHGLEGMRIQPGMDVIHIAGIDTLWLSVELYADQLPWVGEHTPATITFTYFPGEVFRGRVRYVEPEVSETTRTVRLTLEVPNPGRRLRVGMYATVVFEPVQVADAVTVPSRAVLRTGTRNVVVVALGGGRFAPREVTLGREGEGYIQVLEGIEAGERIVTSAQFLIDSESNLREAIRKMAPAGRTDDADTGGDPAAGHQH
ncbi:MAG TPA: efflux RND transporter periplasmic adaptor subunit [Methylomirabilota bacterium]|nr:efflux RND transporter periplasmic adaptor subunit [Methylomirabilota bacterium]